MIYKILRSFLFQQDPEKIHSSALFVGKQLQKTKLLSPLKHYCSINSSKLEQTILGINFKNPIGLAAGFDKNGELIPLLRSLGFGFIEIGSITAIPSLGNPKPRIFRLPKDQAIINRMGLNNDGASVIKKELQKIPAALPYAVNIAKTHSPLILGKDAVDDFLDSYNQLKNFGLYTAINISCPNTKEGKTFETDKQALSDLLQGLSAQKSSLPLLLKISPDLSSEELSQIVEIATKYKVDGFIIGNTTTHRQELKTSPSKLLEIGAGGLSGTPLRDKSNQVISELYRQTCGKFPIIGTGGIMNAQDVLDKIRSGASLVQLYTGLIYQGPFIVRQINLELDNFMKKHNISNISQLRGTYHGN